MKRSLFFLMLMNLSVLSFAQDKNDKPHITKTFANEVIKNVEAETSGGSITVAGVTDGQAKVEVYVRPSDWKKNAISSEEIQKRLDEDYKLTVEVVNNKLRTIAEPKQRIRDWKKALSISFKIYVPGNVSTELHTSGGSIHLSDLSGTQRFSTSGGSLHVDKLKGDIRGRTSGGSIHVKDCNEDIDLATSGGSIDAANCTGKIKLATSGGSLELKNLNGTIDAATSGGSVTGESIKGELEAHTSGGSISMRKLACSLATSTSGGNISIEITELGQFAKITNSGGNIDVELPNKGLDLNVRGSKIKTNDLRNFSGSVEDDEINGKLNGGGIPVTIKANSGRVNLALK